MLPVAYQPQPVQSLPRSLFWICQAAAPHSPGGTCLYSTMMTAGFVSGCWASADCDLHPHRPSTVRVRGALQAQHREDSYPGSLTALKYRSRLAKAATPGFLMLLACTTALFVMAEVLIKICMHCASACCCVPGAPAALRTC